MLKPLPCLFNDNPDLLLLASHPEIWFDWLQEFRLTLQVFALLIENDFSRGPAPPLKYFWFDTLNFTRQKSDSLHQKQTAWSKLL